MQYRIELSKAILIAVKNKRNKTRMLPPKIKGITLVHKAVIKSKAVVVNADGKIIMAPKRRYQIL